MPHQKGHSRSGASSQGAPTRRDLLLGAGAVAGALALGPSPLRADHPKTEATPFDFSKPQPARARKSFQDLSDDEVRAFASAVGVMRARVPISGPLQWDNLAATHAHHCTEDGPDMLQVHWSYFFLPWHRAFLFFLERHLADVIDKDLKNKPISADKFALPYWDWVNHKNIPNTSTCEKDGKASPFFGMDLGAKFDPAGEADPDPYNLALLDGYRGPTVEKPDMKPASEPTQKWSEYTAYIRDFTTGAAQIKSILAQPNFCVFGGFPTIDASTGMGLLESLPHNTIHDWVGTRFGRNRDMGSLRYAALDPIFYLHHGNIDRIWSLYPNTPDPDGKPAATNCITTEAALKKWADQTFEFLDIDGKMYSVTVRDTIKNMTKITYAEPVKGEKLLAARAAKAPAERGATLLSESTRLTNEMVAKVTLAPRAFEKDSKDVRAGSPKSAVLEIEVGDFAYDGRFQVRVFAKKDASHETPLSDESFVGAFQVLDSHSTSTKKKHLFFVDVSPAVSNFFKLAPEGKPADLTLVAGGGSPRGASFYLDVKRVALRVYE